MSSAMSTTPSNSIRSSMPEAVRSQQPQVSITLAAPRSRPVSAEEASLKAKSISRALRRAANKSRAPTSVIAGGGGFQARRGDRAFRLGVLASFAAFVVAPVPRRLDLLGTDRQQAICDRNEILAARRRSVDPRLAERRRRRVAGVAADAGRDRFWSISSAAVRWLKRSTRRSACAPCFRGPASIIFRASIRMIPSKTRKILEAAKSTPAST